MSIMWRCNEHGVNNCRCRKAEAVADYSPAPKPEASNPEDISVILGRIRTVAEGTVNRTIRGGGVAIDCYHDAQRIIELIEQAQSAILEKQLSESLKVKS